MLLTLILIFDCLQTREEVTFLTKMYTRNFLSLGSFYCLITLPFKIKNKQKKKQSVLRDIRTKIF